MHQCPSVRRPTLSSQIRRSPLPYQLPQDPTQTLPYPFPYTVLAHACHSIVSTSAVLFSLWFTDGIQRQRHQQPTHAPEAPLLSPPRHAGEGSSSRTD